MDGQPDIIREGNTQSFVQLSETEQICNPWYAVIFSGLFPGWGQWYTGRTLAGIAINAGYFIILILSLLAIPLLFRIHFFISDIWNLFFRVIVVSIWAYGMYDAWQSAHRINRGELAYSGKSMLFWFPAVGWCVTIAGLAFILLAIAGVLIAGTIFPGSLGSTDGFYDMNVSVTARQPDADHIEVVVRNVPDPDEIFEMYSKATDDNGITHTRVIGLDYTDVKKGRVMKFTGPFAGSNHVTTTVLFDDNHTPIMILDTYI